MPASLGDSDCDDRFAFGTKFQSFFDDIESASGWQQAVWWQG